MARRRLWALALVGALLVQLVVLYAPSSPGGLQVEGMDKAIHAAVFAAPTGAALLTGWRSWWLVLLLAVHAPASELVQAFALPRRDGSVGDVVADLTGVALGVLAARLVGRPGRW